MPTIVSAATAASPLIDEQENLIAEGVLSAVLASSSIPNSILVKQLKGFGAQADAMYRYGIAEDGFINGIPEGDQLTVNNMDTTVVEAVIESFVGEPVTVTKGTIGLALPSYVVFQHMEDTGQNYDYDTYIVTNPPMSIGKTIYVDATTLNDVYDPTVNTGVGIIEEGTILIPYYYYKTVSDGGGRGGTRTIRMFQNRTVNVSHLNATSPEFYNIEYYIVSDVTRRERYWTYNPASNVYPILPPAEVSEYSAPFFPIVPLRTNKVNTVDSGDPVLISSCTKALDYISVNIDSVTESLNTNPEIDDVDDAFITFSVNLNTENQPAMEYLRLFFHTAMTTSNYTKRGYDEWLVYLNSLSQNNQATYGPDANQIYIHDKEFNLRLYYYYIDEVFLAGSIGEIGTITKEVQQHAHISWGRTISGRGGASGLVDTNLLIFRKQIDSSTYSQLTIQGLKHVTHIHRNANYVLKTLYTSLDLTDEGFIIPVNRDLIKTFSSAEETAIYSDSLRILIYAIHYTDIKWYQSEAYAPVFIIIAAIIFIFTFDPEAFGWYAALVYLAKAYAIKYILSYLVEEIGGEAALILAAIITIVSMYYGVTGSMSDMPWAQELMMAVTALIQNVNEITQQGFAELKDETTEFLQSAEDKEEELASANELLGESGINPFTVMRGVPVFNPNETPDDYYTRTIHTTNPGVVSLDVISNYVTNSLQLPVYGEFDKFDA